MRRLLNTLALLLIVTPALAVELTTGDVNQYVEVFVQDSSVTTGAGLPGLTSGSGSLTCYYRTGATGQVTALTLTDDGTPAYNDSYVVGNFIALDNTNAPGLYRLDIPDSFMTSDGFTSLYLKGATNMAPVVMRIKSVPALITLLNINDEVDTALNTAMPASPFPGSINDRVSSGGQDVMLSTTIATLASQTSFTLTAGSADNSAYYNCSIIIEDATTSTQKAVSQISAYAGGTKTVTLSVAPPTTTFTMAAGDKVYILAKQAANIVEVNDVNLQGDGAGTPWGP